MPDIAAAFKAEAARIARKETSREPAIGLGSRRPIDLLWAEDGIRLVETLLKRVEHCVYT